jgi:hypothetical protein
MIHTPASLSHCRFLCGVWLRDVSQYMINEGTAFSKRSTWWDAIFMCFRGGSRDEGVMGSERDHLRTLDRSQRVVQLR